MTELFGGVFQRTELSEALTEIVKMDPTFDKERFLLECEYDVIPNVLEAMIRPDLEVSIEDSDYSNIILQCIPYIINGTIYFILYAVYYRVLWVIERSVSSSPGARGMKPVYYSMGIVHSF